MPIAFLIFVSGCICGSLSADQKWCPFSRSEDFVNISTECNHEPTKVPVATTITGVPSGCNVTIKCKNHLSSPTKQTALIFNCDNGKWIPEKPKCRCEYLQIKESTLEWILDSHKSENICKMIKKKSEKLGVLNFRTKLTSQILF